MALKRNGSSRMQNMMTNFSISLLFTRGQHLSWIKKSDCASLHVSVRCKWISWDLNGSRSRFVLYETKPDSPLKVFYLTLYLINHKVFFFTWIATQDVVLFSWFYVHGLSSKESIELIHLK